MCPLLSAFAKTIHSIQTAWQDKSERLEFIGYQFDQVEEQEPFIKDIFYECLQCDPQFEEHKKKFNNANLHKTFANLVKARRQNSNLQSPINAPRQVQPTGTRAERNISGSRPNSNLMMNFETQLGNPTGVSSYNYGPDLSRGSQMADNKDPNPHFSGRPSLFQTIPKQEPWLENNPNDLSASLLEDIRRLELQDNQQNNYLRTVVKSDARSSTNSNPPSQSMNKPVDNKKLQEPVQPPVNNSVRSSMAQPEQVIGINEFKECKDFLNYR